MTAHPTIPKDKALKVNLDPLHYGTFAEIGAGQEVVRWFFQAGGAAGMIAKSISAYDMKVSDAIYGSCARYVCRERLQARGSVILAVVKRALGPGAVLVLSDHLGMAGHDNAALHHIEPRIVHTLGRPAEDITVLAIVDAIEGAKRSSAIAARYSPARRVGRPTGCAPSMQ